MPRDLRAHGSPQPEPRLLPSDPYTSPRGGDVVSHFVTLLSPEGARYPRLSTADSTDSAVALLSQEPLVQTECLAGEGTPPSPAATVGLEVAVPFLHERHGETHYRGVVSAIRAHSYLVKFPEVDGKWTRPWTVADDRLFSIAGA